MENIKKISKKIEGETWTTAKDKALEKALKKVKIDGFRQGKVPKDVFLKKYGEESVFYDAADDVLNKVYTEVMVENKDLEIVAQPEINVLSIDKDGVEFEFTLTLKPSVKLGKYTNLKTKKETVKVTKEEIENTIKEMQAKYKENVVKEGKLENGDTANINFKGLLDGVAFEGGTSENYSLVIGSNTFIPGFEEQLIGMEVNEERNINVTFPEEYHSEDLKGKPVVFEVKLNSITTEVYPELNEEFFEDLAMEDVNSKESLEKVVKSNIKTHKEMHAEDHYVDDLLEEAASTMEVEIPECMINEETDRMIQQYEQNLKMQGLTLEQFYQFTNSNEDALKDQMNEEAIKRVKYRLMLEEIAKVEKIEISDEDATKEALELSKKYNMEKDAFLNEFGGLEMVKYDQKMRKAIEIIKG